MDILGIIADRKIEEAMAEGEFGRLEGHGQPLDLTEDPHENPESRMANRLLKNNGFAPLWIEEGKELEAARVTLAEELTRAKAQLQAGGARDAYDRRIAVLRQQVASLNCRITGFNFKAPQASHKAPLDSI